MANFVRRLRRESRIMIFAQSLGAIISGFLAWSGFLILLDLYDAFSPIQEAEVSSWLFGAVTVSLFCFLVLFSLHPVTIKKTVHTSKSCFIL